MPGFSSFSSGVFSGRGHIGAGRGEQDDAVRQDRKEKRPGEIREIYILLFFREENNRLEEDQRKDLLFPQGGQRQQAQGQYGNGLALHRKPEVLFFFQGRDADRVEDD